MTFKPDISQIKNLVLKKKYFSRTANKSFTVISINTEKHEIKIGIDGFLKTFDFFQFNKKCMKDGVIED